ncbi:MAG TPA: YggS family pyridoxal phosphate-dependent enzyme [Myxococcota bacterium]|nr:YggS family pyridoxal phosphate-dependent enzyme [Myxococcota bacterium]
MPPRKRPGDRLADRLAHLEHRVAAACLRAGRARSEVTLIGVSKEQPEDLVREAIGLGLVDLGENRVQALERRMDTFGEASPELRWHLIGPVQTNKAKAVARRRPSLLHTVDRIALIDALHKELSKVGGHLGALDVLVQVDIDDEPQKAGVAVAELMPLCEHLARTPTLTLRGLMAIPRPLDEVGEPALARTFDKMARLTETIAPLVASRGRPILSMGMSDDFELAIEHGATHIRVGSALFGPRPA